MKKLIIYGLLSVGALILFNGCSSKLAVCEYKYDATKTKRNFMIAGQQKWNSPSYGYNISTRNTHLLQNAAALTLHYGYKYFAFVKVAGNKINNAQGSLIHTAKGFVDTCTSSSLNVTSLQNAAPCGLGLDGKVYAEINIYKKQPYDMTTYNAQEVKDYLVKHDLWRKDGIEEYMDSCPADFR
ncbi:hypothetical protein [Sulfurospirillum sp. 1612]|uniref:hypothetical protein n=1 Tax=Sulfurospirillum sp. 1612 TaxID=3094835 RepID=UPI002F951BB2